MSILAIFIGLRITKGNKIKFPWTDTSASSKGFSDSQTSFMEKRTRQFIFHFLLEQID